MIGVWDEYRYDRQAAIEVADISRTLRSDRLSWLAGCMGQLDEYRVYGANWNGYGERPIARIALEVAADLLRWIAAEGQEARIAPSAVVPLATGGIQIEWGSEGDVVVEITPVGQTEAWLADSDKSWQLREATDYSDLVRCISR